MLRQTLRMLQPMLRDGKNSGTVVLAYHLIGAGTDSPVDVRKEDFVNHLTEISSHATPVSLNEIWGRNRSSQSRVAFTFDDAFENFFEVVWPELQQRSIPATLFVPAGFVEGIFESPMVGARHLPPCSWSQLREMVGTGLLQIGSHSWSHPDFRQLDESTAEEELRISKEVLSDRLECEVDAFCYPKGLWSRRAESIVCRYYSTAVVGGGSRAIAGKTHRLRVPRTPVRTDSGSSILPILRSRLWLEEWAADRVRRWLR